MPRNPVGGSQWMREKGLTREPQNRTAGLLGEAAGNVLPIVAAAKGPQIAQGLLNHADAYRKYHAATTAPGAPATVWHGSPHRFDKFDSSKIGTGEGAQAYGHGLYFAESPEVAKSYQKTLAADGFLVSDGKVFDPSTLQHINVRAMARRGDLDATIQKAAELAKNGSPVAKLAAQDLATLQQIKASGGIRPNPGNLYKVDLPDSAIARMLDWDKPLSQQPEAVRKAVDALKRGPLDADTARILGDMGGNMNAGSAYTLLGMDDRIGTRAAAAAALRQQGVPGIRYLDGGSRGAGAGSSNFVVFPGEEGLLSILGRE
jgi:hypothetical protein